VRVRVLGRQGDRRRRSRAPRGHLGADEPWKLEWTGRRRDLRRLDAFPRSATGIAQWSAFSYGWPLAKRAKAMARR
jgi:hypothetical protein